MKKLIVVAEKEELKLVRELGYKGIPILITGVGALNIIESLRDIPRDTEIINVGYAGSNCLEVGKFYQVRTVTLHHPVADYLEPTYKCRELDEMFEAHKCYTCCDFMDPGKASGLFDMELAYIMALGFENVRSLKYVSDHMDIKEYRKTLYEK